MSVRDDFTVDWIADPRIIEVAAPATSITVQDIIDTLRVIEYGPSAVTNVHSHERLVDSYGKLDFGGGSYSGIQLVLNNALLKFEPRAGPTWDRCEVKYGILLAVDDVGAFVYPFDDSAYVNVSYEKDISAGLITGSGGATAEEIADAVWDEQMSEHQTGGSAGEAQLESQIDATDLDNIADAVWDEDLSDHQTPGSTGEALQEAADATNFVCKYVAKAAELDEVAGAGTVAPTAEPRAEVKLPMLEKPLHCVVLEHMLTYHFGHSCWEWHPDTMRKELLRTFGEIHPSNLNRIHALQALFVSDAPKKDWLAFEKVLQGLLGNEVLFKVMQRPTIQQLFVGLNNMTTIDPDFQKEIEREVAMYMAAVFSENDIPWAPEPFGSIPGLQEYISKMEKVDPRPYEVDFRSVKKEPASTLLTACLEAIEADSLALKKGLD